VSAPTGGTGQNGRMSRQPGGGPSGDVVRGAGFAAAKGALLIGLAVIIGIFLLQRVDTGDNGSAAGGSAPKTTTTAKSTQTTTGRSTTTTTRLPAKTPAQLHVLVLNGGAPAGEATRQSNALKQKGYTNQDPPNTWTSKSQTGNTALCKPGLDREAQALALAVGSGTTVQPFPTPAPPFSENVDCVVVVGA
jgi:hypothetical protein